MYIHERENWTAFRWDVDELKFICEGTRKVDWEGS